MDFLQELGPLALASRLRRLADRLAQDVAHLYREREVGFEPRWFPVFYLLSRRGPLGVVALARVLGVSHAAVNQIAAELISQGLLESQRDENDKRKRLLTLTPQGRGLLPMLTPIWADVGATVTCLLDEAQPNLLMALDGVETALDEQSIRERIHAGQAASSPAEMAGLNTSPQALPRPLAETAR